MTYKPDYTDVEGYLQLTKEEQKLFCEAWENILDYAMFNGISMLKPKSVYKAHEVVYETIGADDVVYEKRAHIFNMTDITKYIREMTIINDIIKLYDMIDYKYEADLDTCKRYLHITAKQNGFPKVYKVFDADKWE